MLGLILPSSEPALRQEGVRVGENILIIGHGVVAQVEQRLREETHDVCYCAMTEPQQPQLISDGAV